MKTIILALAVIATAVLTSTTTVSATALPRGSPPWIDVIAAYAKGGNTVTSATLELDIVTTGNDANGGYVFREAYWQPVLYLAPTTPPTPEQGAYLEETYESYGLPISLQPGTSPNLATQPPAKTPPKKTPPQLAAWAVDAAAAFAWATTLGNAVPFCAALINPLAALACEAADLAAAAVATDIGLGFLKDIRDPPDPAYTEIVTTTVSPTLDVPDYPGLSPAETAAWSDFVQNLADISVLPDAIATSFNRAQGAVDAGAPQFWVDLQTEAFNGYDQLASGDMIRLQADAAILGLDAFTPATVPEPSTLTLLGTAALLGLVLSRARPQVPPAAA